MKLISLNTWTGKLYEPLAEFVKAHADNTDIFCFQEVSKSSDKGAPLVIPGVTNDIFGALEMMLPEHQGYFTVTQEGFHWGPRDFDMALGNAIFIRKNISVQEDGHVFVHREKSTLDFSEAVEGNWYTFPRLVQYIKTDTLTVFNFHGLWDPAGKGDTPARFEQANKIAEFLRRFSGPKILCGDFNLNPDSQSLKTIHGEMQNLVQDFAITTTRSEHYPHKAAVPYADYTFATPDVQVKSFEVPNLPVSDHLPMIVEFEV